MKGVTNVGKNGYRREEGTKFGRKYVTLGSKVIRAGATEIVFQRKSEMCIVFLYAPNWQTPQLVTPVCNVMLVPVKSQVTALVVCKA